MRHIIRLNVRGQGYTLYSYETTGSLRTLPLDDAQEGSSVAEYMALQRHVDGLMSVRTDRPYLAASASRARNRSLVVYGTWFSAADEFGRPGISLIHGLESSYVDAIALVATVAKLVSPAYLAETAAMAADVAGGAAKASEFVTNLAGKSEAGLSSGPPPPWIEPGRRLSSIRSITHDWGGSALAWLAMASSQLHGKDSQWEIHDEIRADGLVATVSSGGGDGPHILLSDYIQLATRIVDLASLTYEGLGYGAPKPSPSVRPSSGVTDAAAHRPDPGLETGHREERGAVESEVVRFLRAGADVVELDPMNTSEGLFAFVRSGRTYRVPSRRVLSVQRGDLSYAFIVAPSWLKRLLGRGPRLLLLLRDGNNDQRLVHWLNVNKVTVSNVAAGTGSSIH